VPCLLNVSLFAPYLQPTFFHTPSRGAALAATRATGARFASYSLPSLPYDVTALEPVGAHPASICSRKTLSRRAVHDVAATLCAASLREGIFATMHLNAPAQATSDIS